MPLNDNSDNSEKKPVQARKGDVLKFARLLARGWPASKAKVACGFSKNYDTSKLLNTQLAQQAIAQTMATVGEAREKLTQILGFTFLDSCEVDKEIRDDKETPPSTRLKANENIDRKLGYYAPTQVQGEFRSLLLGFTDLGSEDMQALLNHYGQKEESVPQDVVD